MKKYLFFLLLLIASHSFAQPSGGTPMGGTHVINHVIGGMTVDSNFKLPFRTPKPYKWITRSEDTFFTVFVNPVDSLPYYQKRGRSEEYRMITSHDTTHLIVNVATDGLTWTGDWLQNVNYKRLNFAKIHKMILTDDSGRIFFSQDSLYLTNSRNTLFLYKAHDSDIAALGTVTNSGFLGLVAEKLGTNYVAGFSNTGTNFAGYITVPGTTNEYGVSIGNVFTFVSDSINDYTYVGGPTPAGSFNSRWTGTSYNLRNGAGTAIYHTIDDTYNQLMMGSGISGQSSITVGINSFYNFANQVDQSSALQVAASHYGIADTLHNRPYQYLSLTRNGATQYPVFCDTTGVMFGTAISFRVRNGANFDTLNSTMTLVNIAPTVATYDTLWVPASTNMYRSVTGTTIMFMVHNTGLGTVRLISVNGETIDGSAVQTIGAGNKRQIYSDGTNIWTN